MRTSELLLQKKKKNVLLRDEKVCHHASGLKYFAYTAAPKPHSCLVLNLGALFIVGCRQLHAGFLFSCF